MDATALQRQNRRIDRLKSQGVHRSTVLVHEQCRPVLDNLRPHFTNPERVEQLELLVEQLHQKIKPTNVAQVRHLSPFRYPGGKTWLVPEVRQWLLAAKKKPAIFVEPFAGGAIVGLSVASENLAEQVFLSELDDDVAAVWDVVFHGKKNDVDNLLKNILNFDVTLENVQSILSKHPKSIKDKAFRTIIKNRTQRGGIMAVGAGLIKVGEAGRGLKSRWYPDTLVKRIEVLRNLQTPVDFEQQDAFEIINRFSDNPDACFFIDPPYTAGGKKAGSRLYAHNEVDHEKLFSVMAKVRGSVMMTYDDSDEVRTMAERHGFRIETVPMKNTHHAIIYELLVLKP